MRVRLPVFLLLVGLVFSSSLLVFGSPQTLEQRHRLQKYFRNTFAKLEGHDPVHVVLLGDGNIGAFSPDGIERVSGDALNGFAGVFLEKVAREFFYTGGVRLLNPPKDGNQKIQDFLGPEIRFENLAEPNSSVLRGLQRAKSDAFLNDPDLVIIQFGGTDALNRMSTVTFRKALLRILQECVERNVDVIVVGPTPINSGGGAMDWGITRPFVTAASHCCQMIKQAAKDRGTDHDVMFIDAGNYLARSGGAANPKDEPLAGMAMIGDRLKRLFFVEGRPEKVEEIQTLNAKAHQDLGKHMFRDFLNGPDRPDFTAEGIAEFLSDGKVKVVVSILNQSADARSGIFGALSVGGLTPVNPAQRYQIESGKKQEFVFEYQRPVIGKSGRETDIRYPFEVDDDYIRFPFIIEDGVMSSFLDLPLMVRPLSVNWNRIYHNVSNQMRIEWQFVSGMDRAISGTYRLSMGGGVDKPRAFTIQPLELQRMGVNLRFDAPKGTDCFQSDISLEVEIENQKFLFTREMEASRDLVLGEELTLASSAYFNANTGIKLVEKVAAVPSAYFDAVVDGKDPRKSGLYGFIDLKGVTIPDLRDNAAIRVVLTVDGRAAGDVRQFGPVSPIVIYFKGSGGPGYVPSLPVGAFGGSYNLNLHPAGIASVLKGQTIQIKVPQSYLNSLDWNIGGNSLVGIRMDVSVADSSQPNIPFPPEKTFRTHYPKVIFENQGICGMSDEDAQSLTVLRFSRQPVNSWSVRVY